MKKIQGGLAAIPQKFGRAAQPIPASRSRLGSNFWLSLTILGGAVVAASLVYYKIALAIGTSSGIGQAELLEQDAYATLFLVLLGLAVTFLGVNHLLRTLGHGEGSSSILVTLSSILSEKRSARIFVLSALAYGFFFAIVSSTLVYRPGGIFSETYGVHVPSIVPVVCCGSIGQVPQFVVYVTQQFGILLIPVNVILLFVVSWLVALNASVAAFVYRNRPQTAGARWIGGLGAIIGLFTACPTCAGFSLLTILGLSGAVSLALTLTSLQGLFILVGIPILVATPLLTSRRIVNGNNVKTCLISENNRNPPKEAH